MKYLLAFLLLAGSVWGDCTGHALGEIIISDNVVLPYCPDGRGGCLVLHYGTQQEVDSMLMAVKPHEYYMDTVEVCDTVWYYNKPILFVNGIWKLDSVPQITTRTTIICKSKKQIWLTEKEYDKLMELLRPSEFWIISGDTVGMRMK